jgi:hypothetical protein
MDRVKAAFPKVHTFRSDVSDPKAIGTLSAATSYEDQSLP